MELNEKSFLEELSDIEPSEKNPLKGGYVGIWFSMTDEEIDIFEKKAKNKKKLKKMTKKEKEIILANLNQQLKQAIDNWEFEKAAKIRDQIKEITS